MDITIERDLAIKEQLLDSNKTYENIFGNEEDINLNPNQIFCKQPNLLSDVFCKPIFLKRQGFHAKTGIVRFFVPGTTGSCHAIVNARSIKSFDSTAYTYLD